MFLKPQEVEELTGYKKRSKQCEFLRGRGYSFEIDSWGRPKVLRSHVESRLGGSISRPREPRLRLS